MDQLLPLAVVVPLLAAAAIGALNAPVAPPAARILDLVAIGDQRRGAGLLIVIMIRIAGRDQVYWFAGFRPRTASSSGSTSRSERSAPD